MGYPIAAIQAQQSLNVDQITRQLAACRQALKECDGSGIQHPSPFEDLFAYGVRRRHVVTQRGIAIWFAERNCLRRCRLY
jgi:hypothetical protein